MASYSPYISPEADRRAYQALSNVRRLHDWKQTQQRLHRMECALVHAFLEKHQDKRPFDVAAAIGAGVFALKAGRSLQQAQQKAEQTIAELVARP